MQLVQFDVAGTVSIGWSNFVIVCTLLAKRRRIAGIIFRTPYHETGELYGSLGAFPLALHSWCQLNLAQYSSFGTNFLIPPFAPERGRVLCAFRVLGI